MPLNLVIGPPWSKDEHKKCRGASPFFKPTEANTALFLDLMLALKTRIPLSMALQNKGLHSKSILWDQYEAKQLIWLDLDLFRNLGFIQPCLKLDRGILFSKLKQLVILNPSWWSNFFLEPIWCKAATAALINLLSISPTIDGVAHLYYQSTFYVITIKNMLLSRSCVSTNLLVQISL